MSSDDEVPRADRRPRSVAVIGRELADVERFLDQAPPHSDRGVRDRLETRRAALQRELAAARRRRQD